MIKYLTLLVISICLCGYSIGFSQTPAQDSLKRILPLLNDSARVDCLNALAQYYSQSMTVQTIPNIKASHDSMFYYASLAFNEAVRLNYAYGTAVAVMHQADAEIFFDHFKAGEIYCREAIRRFSQSINKKGLDTVYIILGYALYAQSHYSEALRFLDTARDLFSLEGDTKAKYAAIGLQAALYKERGNYEKFFELARNVLEMTRENNDYIHYRYTLYDIGDLFLSLGDYQSAMDYLQQAYQGLAPSSYPNFLGISAFLDFVIVKEKFGQYDSVKYYLKMVDTTDPRNLRFYLLGTGGFYYSKNDYNNALINFYRSLQLNRTLNDENQVMQALTCIAQTYLSKGQTDSAFSYAKAGLNIATKSGDIDIERKLYLILSSIFESSGKMDSAYIFYKKYTLVNDSILSITLKGKLVAYKFEQKIASLNKEKEFQQVRLRNESQLKKILIGSIAALLILTFIIFRNITLNRKNEASLRVLAENELRIQKLESEKIKQDVQQKTNELTMQALRAQMNPHFIFNSLNSIQRFILQNNSEQATAFLSKFSKLVRLILQNSQTPFITLDNELESLRLYLELEALRFSNHFSYHISYPDDMEISVVKVPPLIIQPYVENAIWHGLMHKTEKGSLNIDISEEEDCLTIRISDDGIGRKESALLASKTPTRYKAMGMRITADRISILNQTYHKNPSIRIHDLVDEQGNAAGTEVTIKIPLVYD